MSLKYKTRASVLTSKSTQGGPFFILHYESRRVLVGPPTDYDQLQLAIRRHFPEIPANHHVSYHTDELAISRGALVEVSEDIWETAIALLDTLSVQSSPKVEASGSSRKRAMKKEDGECGSSCDEIFLVKRPTKKPRIEPALPSRTRTPIPGGTSKPANSKLTLFVRKLWGGVFQIECTPSASIGSLFGAIQNKLGGDADDCRILWAGRELRDNTPGTIESIGLKNKHTIFLSKPQRGGKPVIYLFPPGSAEIDASVKLSLVPEWCFSGIYPVVPINSLASGGQALEWDVKASSDGTLLEKNTGLEVAYLFWEAEALALSKQIPLPNERPPLGHLTTDETFIPTHAHLEPFNSVVLEVAKITPYLDSALKALGLHTEARTSFITYWLPSILKHTYVALRFLPQQAYERAAPLEVSPVPDLVVRVFMLFKGLKPVEVSPENTSGWNIPIGDVDVDRWRKIVGIDENRSLADDALFRVLEWGGMEVLS